MSMLSRCQPNERHELAGNQDNVDGLYVTNVEFSPHLPRYSHFCDESNFSTSQKMLVEAEVRQNNGHSLTQSATKDDSRTVIGSDLEYRDRRIVVDPQGARSSYKRER